MNALLSDPTGRQREWSSVASEALTMPVIHLSGMSGESEHRRAVSRALEGTQHTDEDRTQIVGLLRWLHDQRAVLAGNRVARGVFKPEGVSREAILVLGEAGAREQHHQSELFAISGLVRGMLPYAVGEVRGGPLIPLVRCAEYEAAGIGAVDARARELGPAKDRPSSQMLRTLVALRV